MQHPQSFVVVGGGSAGTLSALSLRARFPAASVTLIKSPDIDIIGVGESTTYLVPFFLHKILKIPQQRFLAEVRVSLKTGTRLEWNAQGPYYYSFDSALLRWNRDQLPQEPGFYGIGDLERQRAVSPYTLSMNSNRAPVVPVLTQAPKTPASQGPWTLEPGQFGYHFDNHYFVKFLERLCTERNIELVTGTVTRVCADAQSGFIHGLERGDQPPLFGDFFVDCTGFGALLMAQHFGVTFHEYKHLLARRAVVGWQENRQTPIRPYTRSRALPAGWLFTIDHRSTAHGYVYSPAFISDQEASVTFHEHTNFLVQKTRVLEFEPRRLSRAWCANAVAMGNAAGFLEPLQSTAIHMIAQQNMWLADLLAVGGAFEPKASRYNSLVAGLWDATASFIGLHYVYQSVHKNEFWRAAAQAGQQGLGAFADAVAAYEAYGPTNALRWHLNDIPLFGTLGFLTNMLGLCAPTRAQKADHPAWNRHVEALTAQTQAVPLLEDLLPYLWAPASVPDSGFFQFVNW